MGGTFCEEFQWKNLGFNFYRVEAIHEAQWRWPSEVFVWVRLLMAGFFIGTFGYMVSQQADASFLLYLSNWTYLLATLTFFMGAAATVSGHNRKVAAGSAGGCRKAGHRARNKCPKEDATLDWHFKASWFLFSVTDAVVPVLTVDYFVYEVFQSTTSQAVSFLFLGVVPYSSFLSAGVLLDACISARPTRLYHLIYAIALGWIYFFFTVVYWWVNKDGGVIYTGLNWNEPNRSFAVVAGVVLGGFTAATLARFIIYQIRLCVYGRIYGEPY